jgi:hypothetical protein
MMSKDIYAEMRQLARDYAEAEAKRTYLAEFRKSKKAMLMKQAESASPGISAAAQEREAYANQEYQDLLKGLESATEVALRAKWELNIIQTRFESWRTKEATKRAEMNLR